MAAWSLASAAAASSSSSSAAVEPAAAKAAVLEGWNLEAMQYQAKALGYLRVGISYSPLAIAAATVASS